MLGIAGGLDPQRLMSRSHVPSSVHIPVMTATFVFGCSLQLLSDHHQVIFPFRNINTIKSARGRYSHQGVAYIFKFDINIIYALLVSRHGLDYIFHDKL